MGRFMSGSLACLLCYTAITLGQTPATTPNSKNVEHVRHTDETLTKLGGGTFDAGINKLGAQGFELVIVTSIQDTGAAGFYYFKRPSLPADAPRIALEYKRLDSAEIEKLGNANFDAGLTTIEQEGWELVAVTVNIKGGSGFHYFKRIKK